tara:strand:- start:190 stop:1749 length:1560 start_codon:yes stop_codon:yes gene_type:complete
MNMKWQHLYNIGLLFEKVVRDNLSNSAIKTRERVYSYQELNEEANQIACFLLKKKVKRKEVIIILSDKYFSGYAAMLACIKIGAVYTNVDEQNPAERLRKILKTCGSTLMITDHNPSREVFSVCGEEGIEIVDFSQGEIKDELYKFDKDNLEETVKVTGSDPAYIMFTSGSTGIPKGVTIANSSVINFIAWSAGRFRVGTGDVFANVSPLYFDNSVFDFYTALFTGACLVPVESHLLKSPKQIVELVDELGCTVWFSVPSLLIYLTTMKVLTEEKMKSIRYFIFGGEGYPKSELKKLYDLYSCRAQFVNVYGPTEGTCICSSYDVKEKDFDNLEGLPLLGEINSNFDYLVLDNDNQPSQEGELCLLGPNIGLGYYNKRERTEKSFSFNPLNRAYKERMYRTGDLVKIDRDESGLLSFIGRKDNQVKHMGYRIELEEIESAMNGLPFISQSAVIYKRNRTAHGKIIGFVATENAVEENELRNTLRKILPDYMVPSIIKVMECLPKNLNGKIDKHRLSELV